MSMVHPTTTTTGGEKEGEKGQKGEEEKGASRAGER